MGNGDFIQQQRMQYANVVNPSPQYSVFAGNDYNRQNQLYGQQQNNNGYLHGNGNGIYGNQNAKAQNPIKSAFINKPIVTVSSKMN